MALYELGQLLSENSYPGRGIVIGKTADRDSAIFSLNKCIRSPPMPRK